MDSMVLGISKALLWLADYNLLYTASDLQPLNILLLFNAGEARLLDYDDMLVVKGLGARLKA
jgi:hypothetical protein